MGWVESISGAICYIEENITEEITVEKIAKKVFISPFYFQKCFSMMCGFTVSEYIRKRRLSLAGSELVSTDNKIIDIAVKYGYDSPDSFTKAFTRFHGVTPTEVRKEGAVIKSFAPLKIKFTLEGGFTMDYQIIEKNAFQVMGVSRIFKYENAFNEIPKFWQEHFRNGGGEKVCGMYGVNIDEAMGMNEFTYMIADDYSAEKCIPTGCDVKNFSAGTWAVFPCRGAMPDSLQNVNKKIFSEWLPNCKDYEIAFGCSIEFYSNPNEYKNGTLDENYYSEIWIPVKKK